MSYKLFGKRTGKQNSNSENYNYIYILNSSNYITRVSKQTLANLNQNMKTSVQISQKINSEWHNTADKISDPTEIQNLKFDKFHKIENNKTNQSDTAMIKRFKHTFFFEHT